MRTLHGLHVNGFPNAFIVQVAQAANFIVNVPHNWSDAGDTIAAVVKHARGTGTRIIEATPDAQAKWVALVQTAVPGMAGAAADCTPGYYNNEGKGRDISGGFPSGYPLGPAAYFDYIDRWRRSGKFEGLTFA